MKVYRNVGPKEIADRIRPEHRGIPIRSAKDVLDWQRTTDQQLTAGCIVATFVIDTDGVLLIADRRSEHVGCAGGQPVLSAGEMTFSLSPAVEIVEASNQSAGYCPEPESWGSVSAALERAGLVGPPGFSWECLFRRCAACGSITLVKDGLFRCGMCNSSLPQEYNVQPA